MKILHTVSQTFLTISCSIMSSETRYFELLVGMQIDFALSYLEYKSTFPKMFSKYIKNVVKSP